MNWIILNYFHSPAITIGLVLFNKFKCYSVCVLGHFSFILLSIVVFFHDYTGNGIGYAL